MDKHDLKPRIVRIMGKRYDVQWDTTLATEEDYGEQNDVLCALAVRAGLPPDEERETLLHELLHAIDGQLGIDRPEREHALRSLAIFEMFKTNPGLSRFIFE